MNSKGQKWCWFAASALIGCALCGCTNPGRAERERLSHDYETNLIAETERALEEVGGPLTLSNAVELARSRTLKLAGEELAVALARIRSATAFSSFLPTVAFTGGGGLVGGSIDNLPMLGDISTDGALRIHGGSMIVAQPIFTPVAWVMYAETRYGIRIKEIVRERTEQLLTVQVAARFYRAAVCEREVGVCERQLESARALTNRLTRLVAEGYALESDRLRAAARCAVIESALVHAKNARLQTRSELADILRFWPLAEFAIDGDSLLKLPLVEERPLEEWVWKGLVTRKDLYAGDQTVEYRKARVIQALANFLPNIVLGGGGAGISAKDVALRGWAGSLVGTWAAFEGFRSVNAYRAARAEREAEFKLQEDRMTAVVVAVADSWRQLGEARTKSEAARIWAEAARQDHLSTERRYEDGRETFSAVLDKLAVRDEAELKAVESEYAVAMASVLLRQAVGMDVFTEEKGSHEEK